jgi:hypothetical protein
MNKLKIEITDFSSLSKHSLDMVVRLRSLFPEAGMGPILTPSTSMEFPVRWKIAVEGVELEWVVSEMGSITLRLGAHPRFRKNPPPIFYLSLGKYEKEGFLWEDPEGNPIQNIEEKLLLLVSEKINLFIQSETN